MTDVKAVATGRSHTMFLKNASTLWSVGYNYGGQLGDSTTTNVTTPKQVTTDIKSVAIGAFHTLILKNDNTLWATEDNEYSQLGLNLGSSYYTSTFTKIPL